MTSITTEFKRLFSPICNDLVIFALPEVIAFLTPLLVSICNSPSCPALENRSEFGAPSVIAMVLVLLEMSMAGIHDLNVVPSTSINVALLPFKICSFPSAAVLVPPFSPT